MLLINTIMINKLKHLLYKIFRECYILLNRILLRFGFLLIKNKNLQSKNSFTENLITMLEDKDNILSIVFSKDRAMQLHAFLTSYMDNVENKSIVYILYKTSNSSHYKSYQELQKLFKNEDFVFIEEHNFRTQLLDILKNTF